MDLAVLLRHIPDFPAKGVLFRDITPLLGSPEGFRTAVERMAEPFRGERIDRVMAVESRGFLFGAPLSMLLGAGFVPLRKPGKLPAPAWREDYTLEYGAAALEVHRDAIRPGERVLLVDDVIATGGTLVAAAALAKRLEAHVVGASVLIELTALKGRKALHGVRLESVLRF
jgi:adenine phosphoribosyltransferase